MPTLDVGAGRTSQDECHLSTKHVSPAHQVGPACPLARAQGRSTPVRRQVSERLRQDLLRGWRKTGTSRTLWWPGERSGGPESSCDQCRLRSSEPPRGLPQAQPTRLWIMAISDAAFRQQDYGILEPRSSQGRRLAPSSRKYAQPKGSWPGPPAPAPAPTRLTTAMTSRLPMVRMARDTRSRGCVSTLSAMARSFPRAGQHLCGITVSSPSTHSTRGAHSPKAQQSESF